MKFLIQRSLFFVFLLVSVLALANGTDTQAKHDHDPGTLPDDLRSCTSAQLKGPWKIYESDTEHVKKGEVLTIYEEVTDSNQFKFKGAFEGGPGFYEGKCDKPLFKIKGNFTDADDCVHKVTVKRTANTDQGDSSNDNKPRRIEVKLKAKDCKHPGVAHGEEDKQD